MLRFLFLALAALLVPATAAKASARAAIVDPVGDVRLSFEPVTDLTGVTVTWDGTLVISVAYAGPPRSPQLSLLVTAASADAHDPSVEECDPEMADALSVDAAGGVATLEVNGIDGVLRAEGRVDGTIITYAFASDALGRGLSLSDPFVCASGSADGDAFYGGFDGRELKITPAVAERGARAELARRYGSRFTSSRRTEIRCLQRAITAEQMADEYTDYIPASAWCAYEFRQNARTYRSGEVRVVLDTGIPRARDFYSRVFPNGLRPCGTTDFSGRWLEPPFPPSFGGAWLSVWAKRVPCTTARRLARGGNPRGFRCRTTKQAHEFHAMTCTRSGGRELRFETGA